ncbi:hypothetical protein M406DRAFT_356287 [Cryphonectria parasitica EP155]|uniref:Uncharacterized protein n=1 Tax=Cryphonectria parasitica (strain ATCC 38755 / EP155) TaxID=660469 RepID=A0A9P4Y4E8_CRYP1|nr:uncharacterized protein M406DRAFT_356287 [Cryphonectria parasitica EP155]KAF3766331.1 hypothetical protein M406DRAFT_356287 [Cryphonectria parasitica EP155]
MAAAAGDFPAVQQQQPVMARAVVVQSPMDVATPSIERFEEDARIYDDDAMADVTMSDSEVHEGSSSLAEVDPRRAISLTPSEMDIDMLATPTVPPSSKNLNQIMAMESAVSRLARRAEEAQSESLFNPVTGSRQDTPVPAEMATEMRE